MLAATYSTKKELKVAVGKPLRYQETSMMGTEYHSDGLLTVVGPSPYKRVWYATITMKAGLISKVS